MQPRFQNKITHLTWLAAVACSLACLIACARPGSVQPTLAPVAPRLIGATIPKEDAAADIDTLFITLEHGRPSLYAKRSREEVLAARRRLVAGLVGRVGRGDLWMRLAPVIASLGDRRIVLHLPVEEVQRRLSTGELYFPLQLRVVKTRNGAPRWIGSTGERVVEINGQAAEDLLFRFSLPYVGSTPYARAVSATRALGDLLLLHGIPAPFEVRWARSDGTERVETLAGITGTAISSGTPTSKAAQMFRLPHSMLLASAAAQAPR
jgi:hypothetical protein